ncbi:MAG: EAL domain-containing protein, partial [Sulfuricaulis sp.]|nr:EAL domain-containing protein [Sulfuricaulis sp.]
GVSGDGELGQLAHTFDDMANAIEARRDEIQRANDALRDSEERFRILVEATSDWIWEMDARGVYTYASPKIRDLLGYAPEEVVGKTPFDFMPPDEAARIREQFTEIVATRRPFEHLENTNLHKDGGRVVIETSGVPIFDREGRLAGYRGIDRDITRRKQVEAALLESEAKLRTVSESARDAILMIDDRGKITFWNHAAETMFGYRREETLGKDMAELIVPARLREMHNQGLGAFQRTGQGPAVGKLLELPARRRDGSEFIAEHSISAVKLEGKWHAVGIVRDITDRRQAEAAYHQDHELLEKIFTTTHILIAYLDTDFNFVRVNRAYAEADGRPPEFFAGKNHFALYPGAEAEAIFRRVAQTGEPYTVYARPFTYPDHPERGVTFWDWSLQPVRDPGGKISGLLFSLVNVTDRVHAQEQVQYLAYHDELTGLPNRTLLLDRLKLNIADADRHKRQVAVLCLDLNDFKNVNDTLGHDVGNQAIKTLGGRLSECVRPGDTVARLGGDEFCVALADLAHPDDVAEIIQKILDQFTHTFHVMDHDLYLATALGASLYPTDGRDPETLLKNADIAMYRAKERGDNYQYYSADMTLTASEHLALENDLRHVLERNELLLHYQPQVNLASGKITGVEALVRWQHPKRGMISPAKFIPLAENTNLIIPIGAWVLRTACAQGMAWQEQGLPPLRVAVNFSARQFRLPNLDSVIRQILDETALDPRLLDIELTESTLIQNPEAIASILGQLEKLGAHISVDDFGTGYSSLSYLKRFPIDILKIDQSFVHDIATDPDDAAIVIAIITMAHALGIQTIAEGVETREQLDFLRQHGCDGIQGYFFSKPVEASAIVELFRRHQCLPVKKQRGRGKR